LKETVASDSAGSWKTNAPPGPDWSSEGASGWKWESKEESMSGWWLNVVDASSALLPFGQPSQSCMASQEVATPASSADIRDDSRLELRSAIGPTP
jgi:hypothetical protein